MASIPAVSSAIQALDLGCKLQTKEKSNRSRHIDALDLANQDRRVQLLRSALPGFIVLQQLMQQQSHFPLTSFPPEILRLGPARHAGFQRAIEIVEPGIQPMARFRQGSPPLGVQYYETLFPRAGHFTSY